MNIDTQLLNQKAEENFVNRHYYEAIDLYTEVLSKDSENKEAKIGILLSDLALDQENEAQTLFEYYMLLKNEHRQDAEKIIDDLLKNFDGNMEKIASLMQSVNSRAIEQIDGITYADFKELVLRRGSFKRAFEDLMYSTKIVISEDEDFLEFIEGLADNGYEEIALRYLEEANENFLYDKKANALYEKLVKVVKSEDSSKK